ncbi:MAG: hypothetical protein WBC21_04030 [Minisyncoccales bacterium]
MERTDYINLTPTELLNKAYQERMEKEVKEMKPKDLIKGVGFSLIRTKGKCSRCGEEGEVMLVRAFIKYQDPEIGVLKTTEWDVNWCPWCYNDMMGLEQKSDEQIEGLYV